MIRTNIKTNFLIKQIFCENILFFLNFYYQNKSLPLRLFHILKGLREDRQPRSKGLYYY